MQVERRRPYVTAAQLLQAHVEPGVTKIDATFFHEIRYSGVSQLRIDVPAAIAAEVRNTTPEISETPFDPQPDDVAKGYIAWKLTGERELLGPIQIHFTWQQRLDTLEVGQSQDIDLPHFQPRGLDRAWGQIVLVKSETIDLVAGDKPTGLRPLDPQHDLMPGAVVPDAALAFEFQDAWSLDVTATRYQLEVVKHTSIERGLVRTVVTRAGQMAVQALYRMRSARQRLAVTLPSGVEFDTEPLRINGRPTPLERGAKDEFFVPLAGRSTSEPFLMELRYTLPAGDLRIELPAFGDEPAVQQVYVSVFLPQELELVGYQGPWTDEANWEGAAPWSARPAPRVTDPSLVNWVRSGIALTGNPAESFPTDGQVTIFSSLRPAGDPASDLRLTAVRGKWLTFAIFCGVLVVGLLLLRRPLSQRVAALAALAIALLLLGVFWPTLAARVLFGGFWLALVLTLLVWAAVALLTGGARWAWATGSLPLSANRASRRRSTQNSPSSDATVSPGPEPTGTEPASPESSSSEPPPTTEGHSSPSGESPPPSGDGGEGGATHG